MKGLELIKKLVNLGEVVEATDFGMFAACSRDTKFRGAHCGENTTQCWVDPIAGRWGCYSCGAGGDAVKWVLGAKFNNDYARVRDALKWLCEFYGVEYTDTAVDAQQFKTFDTLTQLSWKWHQDLVARPETHEWVQKEYGLTAETIEAFHIGYCPTALTEYDEAFLFSAGLIDEKRNTFLLHRITIPFFVNGQVVWLTGRKLPDGVGPKYQALKQTSHVHPVLYNYDNASNYRDKHEALVFCEGPFDAIRGWQEGLRTVATAGTQVYTRDIRTLTERLLRVADGHKLIIFDSEDTGRGYQGAKGLAQNLLQIACDPFIVELPLEGKAKTDLCDYLKTHSKGDVVALATKAVEEAHTLGNILIGECSYAAEKSKIFNVLGALWGLPDYAADKYLKSLAKATQVPDKELRKMLSGIRKANEKRDTTVGAEFLRTLYFTQDYQYNRDMDLWTGYKTVYVPLVDSIEQGEDVVAEHTEAPVIIQVNMARTGYTVADVKYIKDPLNFEARKELPPKVLSKANHNLWSVDPDSPYSYVNFIETPNMQVGTRQLYDKIYRYFDRFLWLPEDRDKHIMALYCMWSYIYMGFHSTPYLHLNGQKGTGKSTAGEILTQLAFNVCATASTSAAVVYRLAHGGRPTFLIDEAEKLRNPAAGSTEADILTICNAGYSNGPAAMVYRTKLEGNQYEPEGFLAYGPKIYAGIKMIADTLSDRSLLLQFTMPPKDASVENWDAQGQYELGTMQHIRDELFVWSLTKFREIRETFDTLAFDDEIMYTRFRQIWAPLLAIAKVLGPDIYEPVYALAHKKHEMKTAASIENDGVLRAMLTLHKLYEENPQSAGIFKRKSGDLFIDPTKATPAIKNQFIQDQVWENIITGFNAGLLVHYLRAINAVSPIARRSSARVDGKAVNGYVLDMTQVTEFIKGKLGEDYDSPDSDT